MVQLISFTPDLKDLKVELHEVWIAALAAAKRVPEGRLVYIAVDDVNAPNGVRIELVPRGDNAYGTTEPTSSQVAQFVTRGAVMEKTTEVTSNIRGLGDILQDALSRKKLVEQQERAEAMTKALKADNVATTATKKKRVGRKALYSDDMVVQLKVRGNPKRTNSAAYGRFAAMMRVVAEGNGTVAQVLAAGVSRADLAYDVDHNYIEVVEAPEV
jgi:hypothetical protein